ncbi:MAG: hypothetical protein K8F91_00445 [Candidatus Obscuribacterales bacterium]|nr:hypothetical protein [Candidatus Obscuribacterales bacterium]
MDTARFNPTIADLAGDSLRYGRTNFKFFLRQLLIISFIYDLAWDTLLEVLGEGRSLSNLPHKEVVVAGCGLVLLIVVYEMCMRCLAIWLMLDGQQTDFKEALKRTRKPSIIFLFLPTAILEIILIFFMTMIASITAAGDLSGDTTNLIYGLGVIVVALIYILPYSALHFLNLIFAFLAHGRKPSLITGLKSLWLHFRCQPLVFSYAILLFATVDILIQTPAIGASWLLEALQLIPHIDPMILKWISLVMHAVAASIFSVISLGFDTAGAYYLIKTLADRDLCQDLMDDLDSLQ